MNQEKIYPIQYGDNVEECTFEELKGMAATLKSYPDQPPSVFTIMEPNDEFDKNALKLLEKLNLYSPTEIVPKIQQMTSSYKKQKCCQYFRAAYKDDPEFMRLWNHTRFSCEFEICSQTVNPTELQIVQQLKPDTTEYNSAVVYGLKVTEDTSIKCIDNQDYFSKEWINSDPPFFYMDGSKRYENFMSRKVEFMSNANTQPKMRFDGINAIQKTVDAIYQHAGLCVDDSCSVHMHWSNSYAQIDNTLSEHRKFVVYNMLRSWIYYEPVFYKLLKSDRRNSSYALPFLKCFDRNRMSKVRLNQLRDSGKVLKNKVKLNTHLLYRKKYLTYADKKIFNRWYEFKNIFFPKERKCGLNMIPIPKGQDIETQQNARMKFFQQKEPSDFHLEVRLAEQVTNPEFLSFWITLFTVFFCRIMQQSSELIAYYFVHEEDNKSDKTKLFFDIDDFNNKTDRKTLKKQFWALTFEQRKNIDVNDHQNEKLCKKLITEFKKKFLANNAYLSGYFDNIINCGNDDTCHQKYKYRKVT